MLNLFNLCLATLANWIFENHTEDLDNVTFRLSAVLKDLPLCHALSLISTVLYKLNLIISTQQHRTSYESLRKQRELIPLIKICVKTSKVLCIENRYMKNWVNNCNKVMSDLIGKLEVRDILLRDRIIDELINAACED